MSSTSRAAIAGRLGRGHAAASLLITAVLLVGTGVARATQDPVPPWTRVYALVYGESRPKARDFSRSQTRKRPRLLWISYYIDRGRRRWLVDTGFEGARARATFGIRNYTSPLKLLARLGVRPDTITDIFLTHHHFDHAGLVRHFRRARFHAHRSTLRKLGLRGNAFHAPRQVIASMFTAVHVGGHTPGSSVLYTHSAPGKPPLIFTGDECYLLADCRNAVSPPKHALYNLGANSTFLKGLQKDLRRGARIAGGHTLDRPVPRVPSVVRIQ